MLRLMAWSLFAALAGAGLADVLIRPGGAVTLTAALAVAGLLALVALCRSGAARRPLEPRHGTSTWLRVHDAAGMRPAQVVLEAAGRPRPRAPSAGPAA
jgi:hypothetical protein